MHAGRTVVLALAVLAVGSWSVMLLATGVERAIAWAPEVPAEAVVAPVPGVHKVVLPAEQLDKGWAATVKGQHVALGSCTQGPSKVDLAQQAAVGACDGEPITRVQVRRLDQRLELGHCVTEMQLRVTCSG